MKPFNLSRFLIIICLLLVALTFLTGTLHAFGSAKASAPTAFISGANNEPVLDLTPTPTPTGIPESIPGDTTGIIALASVIVVVVLVSVLLGNSRYYKKPLSKKM